MSKLQMLKPRLRLVGLCQVKVLDTKAGATPRMRGRAWMRERETALIAGRFTCVDCGRVSSSNEIDHDVPLEQGGANDPSNYRIRCVDCHRAKTAREAAQRSGHATVRV